MLNRVRGSRAGLERFRRNAIAALAAVMVGTCYPLLLLGVFSSPASATAGSIRAEARSIAIPTSDLDLSSEADRKRLHQRAMRAVRIICGPRRHGDVRSLMMIEDCEAEHRAASTDQLNDYLARRGFPHIGEQ